MSSGEVKGGLHQPYSEILGRDDPRHQRVVSIAGDISNLLNEKKSNIDEAFSAMFMLMKQVAQDEGLNLRATLECFIQSLDEDRKLEAAPPTGVLN